MNLDLTLFTKLHSQSTELFKSAEGRSIQFSKEVIRDHYYPAMRYEDTNHSFYLQLIISESMFDSLKEQEEYYLFVQIENIHFHKKLFLSNLRLDSYQLVEDESDSESDDGRSQRSDDSHHSQPEPEPSTELNPTFTDEPHVDANTSLLHPQQQESPEIHDSKKLNEDMDEVSQFMEMKESLQEKMKEIDLMTNEIQAMYGKLKKKQT